ncbi:MAG TPA: BON domain-containing protein [Terriglobales bacterium]|nr:BON domain-containing protein [Terriglobales bacterium]
MLRRILICTMILLIIAGSGVLVMPATGQAQDNKITDNAVKTLLERKLRKDKLLKDDNIKVTVDNGAVTLSGTVASLADKKKAGEDAEKVAESYKVENDLMLVQTNSSDQQLAKEVGDQIHNNLFYTVFDWIVVQVQSGEVTLSGYVSYTWAKTVFQHLAETVPGVRDVDNRIVALSLSTYDDRLRQSIALAIYSDPMFENYAYDTDPPIHIIVDNGKVTLMGTVETPLEKNSAERIVLFNTEAFGVTNDLEVKNP